MPVAGFAPKKRSLSAYDPVIASDQLKALQLIKNTWGVPVFCRRFFTILAKKEIWKKQATRLVPFDMTRIQLDLTNTAGDNNITVKGRQIGSTTWHILVRLFLPAILEPGSSGLLISQTKPYGAQHFRILQRALKNFARNGQGSSKGTIMTADLFLAHLLHTQYSARHEIVFDFLDSKVLVDTAENPDAGTGLCVDPETWMQKADGTFLRYKKLVVGDWVIDSKGDPVQIQKVFEIPAKRHPYKGAAVKITLQGVRNYPFTVAPNHPVMTDKGLVEAKIIKRGDYVAYPKRQILGNIKVAKFSRTKDRSAAAQTFFEGDVALDRDFGLICGLYLSDGSLTGDRALWITMMTKRKEDWVLARVLARAKEFVETPKRKKNGILLNSVTLNKWVAATFDRGKDSKGQAKKKVPEYWNRWPKDFLLGLLEGWLTGDGYWDCPYAMTGYGSNTKIVCQMKEISIALGLGVPFLAMSSSHGKRNVKIAGKWSRRNYRYHFRLNFHGETYRRLAKRLGLPFYERTKEDRRKTWKEDEKFVYIKVSKVGKRKLKKFLDITVDSKDHLYCLPYALTHNTINHLVATEVAYWMRDPESLLSQAKEAVPAGGTKDYESTPNGMGGYFFEEWQRAQEPKAEFRAHFYPWWWHEEYEQSPAANTDSMTAEEEKMAKEFEWTMKQLTWRRGKQVALRGKFPEKYPENSVSCFLTSGELYFDAEALRWIKFETQKTKPLDSYHGGQLKVYKRRVRGRRYIIGADVAEGKLISTDRADFSAAIVLDMDTGEQCAVYRSHLPPEDYAVDLVDLAQQYNNAMLAIERNGPGGSVLIAVQKQCLYGNIYFHKEWYRERKQVIPMAGYPTNMRTRPISLNRVAAALRNSPEFIHDESFTDECLTFVWRASNKQQLGGKRIPQGAQGCTDDLVMAMACAEYTRLVTLGYLDPIEIPSERYGQIDVEEDDVA